MHFIIQISGYLRLQRIPLSHVLEVYIELMAIQRKISIYN